MFPNVAAVTNCVFTVNLTLLLSVPFFPVILDSDGLSCQMANFQIGTVTTSTRAWNIRVTQYDCTQQDEAGPPGCLQYYTETANYIQKYG